MHQLHADVQNADKLLTTLFDLPQPPENPSSIAYISPLRL
jgi:hypothetical protein